MYIHIIIWLLLAEHTVKVTAQEQCGLTTLGLRPSDEEAPDFAHVKHRVLQLESA